MPSLAAASDGKLSSSVTSSVSKGLVVSQHLASNGGYACLELCAGAGGQALGLERAGFSHAALVELDTDACQTLHTNRPGWNVVQADVRSLSAAAITRGRRISLLAAGVPCPPFSLAGKQLGADDERDLFPAALTLIAAIKPRAVLLENVKGLLQAKFAAYRSGVLQALTALGYRAEWRLLYARDFGVPQLRPRAVLVALEPNSFKRFRWPDRESSPGETALVGSVLRDSMASRGWELADSWAQQAQQIAPTLCGGSKKHGGPDLGPSRARQAWAAIGVNGSGVADAPPAPGDPLPVKLTVGQMALLQGFPPDWTFAGRKTSAYRQVGNAFPPPVAHGVGNRIAEAMEQADNDSPQTGISGKTSSGSSRRPSPLAMPGVRA
ncbi:DNA cytosine methyltransferase [Streptomyces sp. NBC_00878]|uniref:DNA cytosine methyltransferase n=1 Tax=Streptomyces sp. NBC_00878 TaxID=2975854 RepID=UPI002254CAD9|nr:DNA (cytosine-5-)-methyltransferase [Streptomyces sp. NBC_00878]MCX4908399.1 DNA (cytosine-5-)-methyltransferase [Streptomyces sp. NBC_00878]